MIHGKSLSFGENFACFCRQLTRIMHDSWQSSWKCVKHQRERFLDEVSPEEEENLLEEENEEAEVPTAPAVASAAASYPPKSPCYCSRIHQVTLQLCKYATDSFSFVKLLCAPCMLWPAGFHEGWICWVFVWQPKWKPFWTTMDSETISPALYVCLSLRNHQGSQLPWIYVKYD